MRIIACILGFQIAFSTLGAEKVIEASGAEKTLLSQKFTNGVNLVPGPDDANISKVTARILERNHYLRQNFNDEVSSKLFDKYVEALDNLRLFFLQSDVDEFEQYRTKLDDMILKDGNVIPARTIFTRFIQRLHEQYDYVTNLLATEKFTFETDEKYVVIRKKEPRPKTMDEARKVWRDRLRYEYLQEKLNKVEPSEIVTNLTKRYTRVLRMFNDFDNDDVIEIYLTALSHVYDPHSDYMGKSSLENFSIGMKLSLFGIGALLQSEDGICKIKSLTDGGPAQKSKQLKPDDKIIAVGQSNQPPVDVVDNISTALGIAAQGLAATLAPAYIGVLARLFGLEMRRVIDPETVRKVCLYRSALRDPSPAAEGFAAHLSAWMIDWHGAQG